MTSKVTTEIVPGLFQARIPVPFPLKFVNCYLVETAAGWVLVDAGLRYAQAEQAWAQAFDELGLQPDVLRAIYLTHYHPDHFGMAGWMQQRSGAPVFMSSIEAETARIVWGNHVQQARKLRDFFRLYGMPDDIAGPVEEQMRQIFPHTLPHPTITPLQDAGASGPLQGFQPLLYAGHTDGHLCFYEAARRLLIAGDHVLPRITPNISLWPDAHRDPLGAYLESLPQLAELDVALVLPAHGPVFGTYQQRLEELQSHHVERLEQMARVAGQGRTAYAICDAVFPIATLSPHQTRFAMAETLSHLAYLVRRGRLLQEERNGEILFVNPER